MRKKYCLLTIGLLSTFVFLVGEKGTKIECFSHKSDFGLSENATEIKALKRFDQEESALDNLGLNETPETLARDELAIQDFKRLGEDRSGPSYTIPEISDPSNTSTFDPTVVNVEPGKFVYEKFDYSNIQVGDIIFETHVSDALNYIGHVAYVYDIAKQYTDGTNTGTFIETIEAVPSSVRFGWLDDNRMKTQGVIILRPVYANNISTASYFMYGQLGKPYNFPFDSGRVNTSYYSESWYCSELVYAAYYYAGVNLHAVSVNNYCLPRHLYENSYTYTKNFSKTLDIEYLGNPNGKWKIRVRNTNSYQVSFRYNKKMCFSSDAKNWTNLHDLSDPITLNSGATIDVTISINWFATSCTFSYEKTINGTTARFISYCENLNGLTQWMSIYKWVKASNNNWMD